MFVVLVSSVIENCEPLSMVLICVAVCSARNSSALLDVLSAQSLNNKENKPKKTLEFSQFLIDF